MLRSFLAVELAALPLRRSLEMAQAGLRRTLGARDPVKWVPAHQMHITLKFLGDISEEAAPGVLEALRGAAAGRRPFTLQVTGLGAFPSPERPSVLWAGIGAGREELVSLAAAVEDACAQAGYPRERRSFQPHLTLGRVREGQSVGPEFAAALRRAAAQEFGQWQVDRLLFMTSRLTPAGPVYTVYGNVPLREENG